MSNRVINLFSNNFLLLQQVHPSIDNIIYHTSISIKKSNSEREKGDFHWESR